MANSVDPDQTAPIADCSYLFYVHPVCFYSRDRRDVTALATQVNKCTPVKWTVNFNITGNGKMMKNGPYLFKFSDFFNSLFWRENIVFCPAKIILI